MRVIFVPVADRPECAKALRTAFDLGQRLGASVSGCHIRPHSDSGIALPAELKSLAGDDAAWEAAWKSKKRGKSAAQAKALFGKIAKNHDFPPSKKPTLTPGSMWLEKVGSPDKVLSILGPVSDLVIVSRPATKGGKLAHLFMLAAVLNTSRPVLVMPQSGEPLVGRRISIAWNQSAEAAQAVAAAMPLLQMADEVNIICSRRESGVGPKATQLATYLQFWGVKTKRIPLKDSDDSKTLIKAYKNAGSDLLVMGAYSRSRLRERIFGGVTEYMLQQANIPVFMLHT